MVQRPHIHESRDSNDHGYCNIVWKYRHRNRHHYLHTAPNYILRCNSVVLGE